MEVSRLEPRAWILFEVAAHLLTHTERTVTADNRVFVSHVEEMLEEGVSSVISKYGYVCTNGGDLPLVVGWLEMHVILFKCVPNAGIRQQILDDVNRSYVGSYANPMLGIEINKAKGVVSCNGTTYLFTPVYHPTGVSSGISNATNTLAPPPPSNPTLRSKAHHSEPSASSHLPNLLDWIKGTLGSYAFWASKAN